MWQAGAQVEGGTVTDPYANFEPAPVGAYRMVQVLTEGAIYIDFTQQVGGRDYEMLRIPSVGVITPFPVMPEEQLFAMSEFTPGVDGASLVRASLIVQHWIPAEGAL
jgi:hypothetical protein